MWGSEFTSKDAALQGREGGRGISAQPFCSGGLEEMVLNPFEVALGPAVARARVLVHELSRTEELAKRRRAHFPPEAPW